jgi:hypothetical protein
MVFFLLLAVPVVALVAHRDHVVRTFIIERKYSK